MTPDEMRRTADLLLAAAQHGTERPRESECVYLARLLREEADRASDAERYRKLRAPENANVDGVHVYGQNDDCIVCGDDLDAAVDALPPPPQGREEPG